jgi:hypothetical protein
LTPAGRVKIARVKIALTYHCLFHIFNSPGSEFLSIDMVIFGLAVSFLLLRFLSDFGYFLHCTIHHQDQSHKRKDF